MSLFGRRHLPSARQIAFGEVFSKSFSNCMIHVASCNADTSLTLLHEQRSQSGCEEQVLK